MPKVRPLGESAKLKARWDAANASFNRQVGRLLGETGLSATELAALIGVHRVTIANWRKDCTHMTIGDERRLMKVFETYGVPYDRTLGEGAKP